MAESFENLDHISHDLAEVKYKKYCRDIVQVREAQFSRKKKDKAFSFLENGWEKTLERLAVERD